MRALSGSYLKFFAGGQGERERVILCSREIGFLAHQKRVGDGLSLAVSFQPKFVPSISAVSSAQTNVESEEIQTIPSNQPKTVHVRFKLHKECAFGQQFLIVGDDPILGLWDPSNGIPLNWSEGHVWTADMDIPCGKVIKYKFILNGNSETILWQPGPDRILETWDTEKTISVSEDWENPELQNIVEEYFVVEEGEDKIMGFANANENTNYSDKPSANTVAENVFEELDLGKQDLSSSDKGSGLISVTDEKKEEKTLKNNGMVANGSNSSSLKDETRLVLDEGAPVLVPGLVPTPPDEIEVDEVEENNVVENATTNIVENTTDSDEIEETTNSELKDENVSASLHSTETSEMMVDEKQQINGKEERESDVLQSDMQWGRRTLQKFLANLGFI